MGAMAPPGLDAEYEALGLGNQHRRQMKKQKELIEKLGSGEISIGQFERHNRKLNKKKQRLNREFNARSLGF